MSKVRGINLVSLIVRDYDEALAFFVDKLGFSLIEDSPATTSHTNKAKRWVVVQPPGDANNVSLLLARAEGDVQTAMIGNQWAGRVGLFWTVDDFDATYARMREAGVQFIGEPRKEVYGQVVVFCDVMGNKWDLLGPEKEE